MNYTIDLVSIITPSYNSIPYIKYTIESVLSQTYKEWEMIIVDDCSTDKSVHYIEGLCKKDKRIKLFANKTNLGAAETRNKAINEASGEYIAFLDSDDLWKENKLELQLKFMKERNSCFSYTMYDWIDEESKQLRSAFDLPLKVNYWETIKHNKIGCLTVIFKKSCFDSYMMPNIRNRQDFGLWLKLLKQCEYAECLPVNLASYRIRKNSISRNKVKLVKYHWNLYRKIEKHSSVTSLYLVIYLLVAKIFENFKLRMGLG